MQHVVSKPGQSSQIQGTSIKVDRVDVWIDNLVWVLWREDSDLVWVVDGPDADAVLAWCKTRGKRLAGILNTHTHPDHIGINRALARSGQLDDLRVIGPAKVADQIPGLTEAVSDGDTIQILGETVRVWLTEGHLDGHVSYLVGDALFCGDTLFAGGCGYLFDGPPQTMFETLCRLAELPGQTQVYCAHEYTQDNLRFAWFIEPDNAVLAGRIRQAWATRAEGACTVPSTVEEERATNPFLRPGSPTILRRLGELDCLPEPATDGSVFAALRKLKDGGPHKHLEDSTLPLIEPS
ncbi:MAG: hydroxyacylglutathione hydrolase [Myxococcota bacterium]